MAFEGLYSEINTYNNMKFKMYEIVNCLNTSANGIVNLPGVILNSYSFDGDATPIHGKVKKIHDDVASTSSYITGTIIPAIDAAINNTRNRIASLEKQLQEQQEAEAKKRANS